MTIDDTRPRTGALAGIRILDFSQMMLGPFATQYLGDMGADVIKVERPGAGEWERGLELGGRLVGGTSAAFLAMNRNKRSLAIDLKAEGAREVLLELAATCDVVVENFRPGVMDRLGLGYQDFKQVNPAIVYCSGSGWGQDTKYARENRPGQDLLIQAMSGLAANAGLRDQPPVVAGSSLSDAITALTLVNGMLTALLARHHTGEGQRVEVDLFHSTIAVMCQEISAMVNQQQDFVRSATGVAQPWLSAPYGIYRTADGDVAISMGDLAPLAAALDIDLAGLDAWEDRDRIKLRIDEAVAGLQADALVATVLGTGLWAARVRTMREAVDELRADGSPMLRTVDLPGVGEIELVGNPVTLSQTPWQLSRRPPLVGEHTEEILAEVADADRIAHLRAAGAIQ
jgi:crotonobetainyl-CoA:carnitine CoA-transferase CaiB-like acyl-CoA transferase